MLRLKGEPDDADYTRDELPRAEIDDAAGDHPAFAPEQLVDAGGGDGDGLDEIDDDRGPGWLSSVPGLGIAVATFVPTFLIVFFGVPYLLGPASTARTASEAPAVASAPPSWTPDFSLSEALRGSSGTGAAAPSPASPAPVPTPPAAIVPRVTESPAQPAADPAPPERQPAQESVATAPAAPTPRAAPPSAGVEPSPTPAAPALPPARSRVPEPERKAVLEPRSVPAPRQASATPDPVRPRAESRRFSGEWTPAAAFADRDAAVRLADSIERQGYPVEIRQDTASSTRPWVVWIGTQPSGGSGRRR